ncbi:GNAT family N-acetyltransferase [Rhizobiales bacterium]|uniref:GNAT family N-acetyltransferase n=1 Tax=Hongsoonwoonella zoysiae TaxID=2821844 RepID=UPI0015609C1D|nr:GNAT family N-acetyltransferase [Hongsoonwoonella zoysiae]NRG17871.1 GNAT family N-acetyltransferase [Hongsoonwoonella zoysiae]
MNETRDEPLHFSWKTLDDFSPRCLHAVYQLRVAVFIVEQDCAYQEIDDLDADALHLVVSVGEGAGEGTVAAYLRLIRPESEKPVKLGRIVVSPAWRGTGLGRRLMEAGLEKAESLYPGRPVFLSAQTQAARFYAAHGFKPVSPEYLEDGIPHVDMLRSLQEERPGHMS